MNGIQQAKQILAAKIGESSSENQEELTKHIDKVAKSAGSEYILVLWGFGDGQDCFLGVKSVFSTYYIFYNKPAFLFNLSKYF